MKQKQREVEMNLNKKGFESYFWYKLCGIMCRVYELLGGLKTTTSSLHDPKENLLKKMKWFAET